MKPQDIARGSSQLIPRRDVVELTGLSSSTIDRLERANRFPRRRRVSTRAIRWIAGEVIGWIESRELGSSGIGRSLPTGDRG